MDTPLLTAGNLGIKKKKGRAGGQPNEAASYVLLIPLPPTDRIIEKLSKPDDEYLHPCLRNVLCLCETLQYVADIIVLFYNLIGHVVI